MFCTKCGAHNPDEAKFCFSCGSPISLEGTGPAQVVVAPAPPPVVETPAPKPVHYAGFWRRFVAWLIDRLILMIPRAIVGLMFSVPSIMTILNNLEDIENGNFDFLGMIGTFIMASIWITIFKILLDWLYHAIFECSRFQATPGKMALGIIVTDGEHQRISFGRASGRHFAKIISGMILGIGYMMAGWTRKKQALHDMMADTLVVLR